MLKTLFHTDDDPTRLLLRLVLGGVMFAHGAQKLFGWFGGHGFAGTMDHFTGNMGIPALFAFLAILAESAGALALMAGLLTRIAALGIGVVMIVAVAMVHAQHGFFMNWSGEQAGEGFEYHLLALVIAVGLIVKGGGLWSADSALLRQLQRRHPARQQQDQPAGATSAVSAGKHSIIR